MSIYRDLQSFGVAHELCSGDIEIGDPVELRPDSFKVSARCPGCGASMATTGPLEPQDATEQTEVNELLGHIARIMSLTVAEVLALPLAQMNDEIAMHIVHDTQYRERLERLVAAVRRREHKQ